MPVCLGSLPCSTLRTVQGRDGSAEALTAGKTAWRMPLQANTCTHKGDMLMVTPRYVYVGLVLKEGTALVAIESTLFQVFPACVAVQ